MNTLVVRAGLDSATVLSEQNQVVVIGKSKLLKSVNFQDQLEPKFGNLVSLKTWQQLCDQLQPKGTSSIPLYLNLAKVISVPDEASRHNAPSNCLSITKELKSLGRPDSIKMLSVVVLANYCDIFPSVAAVARCFPTYDRTTKKNGKLEKIMIEAVVTDGKSLTDRDIAFLQALVESIGTVGRLVDTPCNELNTEEFVEEALKLTSQLNSVESLIIKDKDLLAKGFGGIYHVGKASHSPPIFACFSHRPANATKTYALVGKGIVYDTGGMQIKSKTGMPGMKRDMAGAAALLAAFHLLTKLGFKQNLHCLLCIADNNISPVANRPDDVITMLSGKTVEISNTDAEGRLVLADGVFYAKNVLNANTIIDMATLTGAQAHATGKYHSAVLTNSGDWERRACSAGQASGDLVHPLPYCPDLHFGDLKSPVADMRNSTFGKMHGPPSSIAGLFIASHVDFSNDIDWLHFDIAYPAETGDRASGYGPALIASLLAGDLDIPLLKVD